MNKIIKKITAALMAAVMSASAFTSVGAVYDDPPVYSCSWSVSYYCTPVGAGYTGTKAYPHMVYSNLGLRIYCNGTSNTTDGATGRATISCKNSNVTMTPVVFSVASPTPVIAKPILVGDIIGLQMEIVAGTGITHNTFRANGTMYTIRQQ